jgi:hypothetical protein
MITWSSFCLRRHSSSAVKCCRYSLGANLCFTGSVWCPIGPTIL